MTDASDLGPLLSGILPALIDFRNAYGTIGNNCLAVPILNNFVFSGYERMSNYLNDQGITNIFPDLTERQRKSLSWLILTNAGSLLSINQLRLRLGTGMTAEGHGKLTKVFHRVKKLFYRPSESTQPFADYISSATKGSKRIRKILMSAYFITNKKEPKCPIVKYMSIAGLPQLEKHFAVHLNKLWTIHYLASDIKSFFFKLHHNILGLNSRVQHINAARDPSCTFCLKSANLPAERESFEHFFWNCPTSAALINKFFNIYFRQGTWVKKTVFFTGIVDEEKKVFSLPIFFICSLLKYILWVFKLKKKLPNWPSFNSEFLYHFNILMASSLKLSDVINGCNLLRHYRD
jgi:hypothetical protein